MHIRHATTTQRFAIGALAVGALAGGALAFGAVAIGALAISRLAVRRARIRSLEIGDLRVQNFQIAGETLPARDYAGDRLTSPMPRTRTPAASRIAPG